MIRSGCCKSGRRKRKDDGEREPAARGVPNLTPGSMQAAPSMLTSDAPVNRSPSPFFIIQFHVISSDPFLYSFFASNNNALPTFHHSRCPAGFPPKLVIPSRHRSRGTLSRTNHPAFQKTDDEHRPSTTAGM